MQPDPAVRKPNRRERRARYTRASSPPVVTERQSRDDARPAKTARARRVRAARRAIRAARRAGRR